MLYVIGFARKWLLTVLHKYMSKTLPILIQLITTRFWLTDVFILSNTMRINQLRINQKHSLFFYCWEIPEFQAPLQLPDDVVCHIIGSVTSVKDKLRLGATCHQFKRVMTSHKDSWLDKVVVEIEAGEWNVKTDCFRLGFRFHSSVMFQWESLTAKCEKFISLQALAVIINGLNWNWE